MTLDLTQIIQAVLALVIAIITSVVIPLIKSKTTENQQRTIRTWVTLAVMAAEQLYRGHGRGDEKKKYVLNWLRANNITIDITKVEALIESAVLEIRKHGGWGEDGKDESADVRR